MNDMSEHKEKIDEMLVQIEGILQQGSTIENYFISACSTKGAILLNCKGDMASLISSALEIMHTQNPDKAMKTVTALLVRVGEWYSLNSNEKRTLH